MTKVEVFSHIGQRPRSEPQGQMCWYEWKNHMLY